MATATTSTTFSSEATGTTEDTAETAAAAAALVVDSVVEGTVAAVLTNSNLPASSNGTTAAAPAATTTEASETNSDLPAPAQSQAPSGESQTPSTTSGDKSSTVKTYNNLQKSKRKERLEQNRISARESRKRKKSMIEELQRTVIALTTENKELNGRNRSLRTNLSDIGRKVCFCFVYYSWVDETKSVLLLLYFQQSF